MVEISAQVHDLPKRLTFLLGPIYELSLGGYKMVVISSWSSVQEDYDDGRFKKPVEGDLEVRIGTNTSSQKLTYDDPGVAACCK